MRVTIIPSDGFVSVDGVGYSGLDLSFIDPAIHAVQWFGDVGELEIKNLTTNKMAENREITSFAEFQRAVDAWDAAKEAAILAMQKLALDLAAAKEAANLQTNSG